jgi:hypothetical protein
MRHIAFALAALAVAGMASAQSSGAKWVPLQQAHETESPRVQAPADPATAPLQVSDPAPLVIEQTPQSQVAGNVLKQGTPIYLATDADMSSQDNRVGDRVDLRVLDAVSLNGHTVIPVGTRGVGEVTLVRRKGMWGKSGRLEFRPLYILLGGRQIPISAHQMTKEKGETGTAGVVASIVVLPLAGFFVTGTSARIPRGSVVDAELSEDLPVVFK